jgi:hypothetical protein
MNVYKLKNGKTSGAFQLAIRGQMVAKSVNGEKVLKKVHYIPGSDSIFVEDYKGDEKPKAVWFDDGELRVAPENKVLNELVQSLSGFNKHYYLVNEEKEAEKEVQDMETLTKASNAIINEKDDYKLQAMAMVLISLDAANWPAMKCKAELLKYAKNHSNLLIAEMAKSDYESRLIAALAFAKNIVKHNLHHTAVVWSDDNEGIIVRVAEGEKGVDKLAQFLSKTSESSTLVLQRIGEKTDALIEVNEEVVVTGTTKSVEEIQAEAIAAYKSTLDPVKTEAEIRAKIMEEMKVSNEEAGVDVKKEVLEDIDALRIEYKNVTGKDLSPRYANDAEWMKEKINAVKNS